MEKMPSRRTVLKGLAAGGIAALTASDTEAQAQPKEELAHEQSEIQRITNELDGAQKEQNKELQQKLLKELEGHLKKAIDLIK